MSASLPVVYIARHGETAWSLSGQHTGLTDIPLTERGERMAIGAGGAAQRHEIRDGALQSAEARLSHLRTGGIRWPKPTIDADLVEWNYGQYEGLTSKQIHAERPDWNLFRDGCPGGEMPEAISRARRQDGGAPEKSAGSDPAFFQRAYHQGSGGALAWPCGRCHGGAASARHRKPERLELRAYTGRAGNTLVERHPSSE